MKQATRIVVANETRQTTVCSQGTLADTSTTRLFGLLGKRSLDEEAGLLIRPSSGVHTFGMSFPIDIVALDRNDTVIGIWESIGPWKIRGLSLKTRSVLELPPGRLSRCPIAVGDRLRVEPAGHEPAV
jgi:uncharacterized membrane protein (UPF0127 family)